MNPRKQVDSILARLGAILKRQHKHQVWQLPNGKTFVRASTPSDTRSDANNLRDLRRVVPEAIPAAVIKNPDRKPKVAHGGNGKRVPLQAAPTVLGSALLSSGAVELALRAKISCLENELSQARFSREVLLQKHAQHFKWSVRCPICRFRRFIQNLRMERP